MMKKVLVAIIVAIGLISCSDDSDIFESVDYAERDEQIIQDYFIANNIIDTIATPYGVYIEHLLEGTGDNPTINDSVTVNYSLYTIPDNNLIEASADPVTFKLSDLITGWQIGIPHMSEGGEANLYIPSSYAYRGTYSPLADDVLKFKITLVDIKE
ncbi:MULTISPECIES: FKBP-type peptidyl-prolyl cis-trans isomerase [unclassified Saccharicrinis]|uniref:FKBP-type peptidyl-prolyl cis-trans isomerase n=1 Tax=unclassified Saccharicrinis TaxID=2646859 RepID=UPI003D3350FF